MNQNRKQVGKIYIYLNKKKKTTVYLYMSVHL